MQTLPLRRRSLLDLMLGRQIKANAIVELHNAVATGGASETHTMLIEQKYEVDLSRSLLRERRAIFRDLVRSLVADHDLSPDDVAKLKASLITLRLSKDDADDVYQQEVTRIYERIARERIVGKGVSADRNELEILKKRLRVDPTVAAKIEAESSALAAVSLVEELIADGYASNEDMRQIDSLCERLNISTEDLPSTTKSRLATARKMRDYLVDPIAPVGVKYNLRNGEDAFVYARGAWFETRVHGSGAYREVSYQRIADGELIITNKRIMVLPYAGKPKSLSWSSVLDVAKISDVEFELMKDRGKIPIIRVEEAIEPQLRQAIPIIAERCCHGTESQRWAKGMYYS